MTIGTVWGLVAEFRTADEILLAARQTREAGYRQFDAFAPYAVEGLAAELGLTRSRLPFLALVGGMVGVAAGFYMQYYSSAINYPLNVGGRPLNSWPVFVPIAFELTILVAACGTFLGMLLLNGLPQPHHPLFSVPQFNRASQTGFFLCIEASDPLFDLDRTVRFLTSLNPTGDVLLVPETEPTGEELPGIAAETPQPGESRSELTTIGSGSRGPR
jgi:ActD protein